MATNINTILSWFKTRSKPTQNQFHATWLSFWHKDEQIPQASISNLTTTLDTKTDQSQFDAHITDDNAHLAAFEKKLDKGDYNGTAEHLKNDIDNFAFTLDDITFGKEDKFNRNRPNGYPGLDSASTILLNQLPSRVIDEQIEISKNSNVQNSWHGKTVLFTTSCVITVPSTLNHQLGFVFRTLTGVTISWVITPPFEWETTPTTTLEKTTGNFMRRGNTNTIILDF